MPGKISRIHTMTVQLWGQSIETGGIVTPAMECEQWHAGTITVLSVCQIAVSFPCECIDWQVALLADISGFQYELQNASAGSKRICFYADQLTGPEDMPFTDISFSQQGIQLRYQRVVTDEEHMLCIRIGKYCQHVPRTVFRSQPFPIFRNQITLHYRNEFLCSLARPGVGTAPGMVEDQLSFKELAGN